MVPDVHQPHTFAEFLEAHLNLTPEFKAAGLSVEQVANVALLTVSLFQLGSEVRQLA